MNRWPTMPVAPGCDWKFGFHGLEHSSVQEDVCRRSHPVPLEYGIALESRLFRKIGRVLHRRQNGVCKLVSAGRAAYVSVRVLWAA